MQGKSVEANELLIRFPASAELPSAEKLRDVTSSLIQLEKGSNFSDDVLEAAFERALRLIRKGNLPAALDGLLDLLREDKHYRDGEVRRIFLGILELMGEQNPDVRQYRQELASVLF